MLCIRATCQVALRAAAVSALDRLKVLMKLSSFLTGAQDSHLQRVIYIYIYIYIHTYIYVYINTYTSGCMYTITT
jgi:hypothetical protein